MIKHASVSFLLVLSMLPAQGGVTGVQNVAPGVTIWPGSPLISTPEPDYTLWTSTKLSDWQVWFATNSPSLPFQFAETNSSDTARFYRVQIGPR